MFFTISKIRGKSNYFYFSIHLNTDSPIPYVSYHPSSLQKILMPFEIILRVWYILSSIVLWWTHTPLLSLLLTIDYTFLFLSTNSSFISIMWSDNFFIGILSLAFFLKTWIYLWNPWGTNFLASSSDFAIFTSPFQIFYSFATFFTSIIFFFLVFSSFFFHHPSSASSLFFSSSFCFCYLNFLYFSLHYFPHFIEHLVIFTSSVLQSIRLGK